VGITEIWNEGLPGALWPEGHSCAALADPACAQTFMTLLSGATAPALEALLACHILKGLRPSDLHRAPSKPAGEQILFEQYWVEAGPAALPDEDTPDEFVLTPSVRHHLSMLARAVLLRKHPILLQVRCARSVLPQSARLAMMQNIPRTENAGTSSDVCGLFDV
jgi:hypothetical protein